MMARPILAADVPVPAQQTMQQVTVMTMSPHEVAQHFAGKGFGEYAHLFQEHNINGARLTMVTGNDLQEMGVTKVGDRIGIQQEVQELKTTARALWRSQVIQEHAEVYPHVWLHWLFHTCCGMCPPQMDRYKLTSSNLKITHSHSPICCGRKCSCLGVRVENDNHPLDQIVDVDTANMRDGCCGVSMTRIDCHLTLGSQGDSVQQRESHDNIKPTATMVVHSRYGEQFAAQIRNQIEEYKRIKNNSFRV